MKKLILLVAAVMVLVLAGCDLFSSKRVNVTIDAGLTGEPAKGLGSRAVHSGDPVTEIDAYRVIFEMINSHCGKIPKAKRKM